MSWDQIDESAGGGAAFVRLNIGDKARLVFKKLVKRFDKEWPDGKIDRDWLLFEVIDADDIDAGIKSLDVAGRRASVLAPLRAELAAKGLDIGDRLIEVECYAEKHPTRPGARIGKWRVTDIGPAPVAADTAAETPSNDAASAGVDAMNAAANVAALKVAFGDAWNATSDVATRSHLKTVYEARKAKISTADADGVPF